MNIIQRLDDLESREAGLEGVLGRIVWSFLGQYESPKTRKAYLNDIQSFFQFLRDITKSPSISCKMLSALKKHHIVAYREQIIKESVSPNTINRRMSAIKSFFDYFYTEQKIASRNPAEIRALTVDKNTVSTIPINDEDLKSILHSIDNTRTGVFHRLLIQLLASSGMRAEELINLRFSNLKIEGEEVYLSFTGKRNRYREVSLGPSCVSALADYMTLLENLDLYDEQNEFLLLSPRTKKKITYSGLREAFEKLKKRSNLAPEITLHSFRARAINKLKGTSIEDLALFVGHSSVITTAQYLRKKPSNTRQIGIGAGL